MSDIFREFGNVLTKERKEYNELLKLQLTDCIAKNEYRRKNNNIMKRLKRSQSRFSLIFGVTYFRNPETLKINLFHILMH